MPKRSKSRRSKSRRKGRSKSRRKTQRSKAPRQVKPEATRTPDSDPEEDEEETSSALAPVGKAGKKKGGKKSKSRGRKGKRSKSGKRKGKGSKSKGRKGKGAKKGKQKPLTDTGEEEESGEEEDEWPEVESDADEDEEESIEEVTASIPASTTTGKRSDDESTGSYSGSGSSSSDLCPSGEYESSSTEDLVPSPSSMTLIVTESRSADACANLEEMEVRMVTKAAIRKCRGIEADDDEEEEESEIEEASHQKEAPDFNYMTTYEEYLDHYVTSKDLYYFESDDVTRTITTLGFRVPELLTREQFAEVMKSIQAKRFAKRKDDVHIAYGIPSADITCPLMQALATREKQNRTGNMACLVYIRMLNQKQQEVSGWIDFKLRLTKDGTELWTDYFRGKNRLVPRHSDLCYYNWTTFQVRYNSSDNYLVTTDIAEGLQFMNKLDRKLITVNPRVKPGDNTEVVKVKSPNYLDAVIYDHFLRVKA